MEIVFKKKFTGEDRSTPLWETEDDKEYSWEDVHDCVMDGHTRNIGDNEDGFFVVINIEKDELLHQDMRILLGYDKTVVLRAEGANVDYHMTTRDFVDASIEERVEQGKILGPFKLVKKGTRTFLKIA